MEKQTPQNKKLNGIIFYLKQKLLSVIICAIFLMENTPAVFAHGTVTSPASRVWICYLENPESPDSPACAAAIISHGTQAFYDWNEVARMDANGMHRDIISDGNLASAGRPDKYGGLDQVRDDWVSTPVSPGPFTVTWTNSAPHQTLYYDVYITKADWTPDQPLTWDSLELLVRTEPRAAAAIDNIDVTLPVRTGKHVIYSIWQRSLTGEAFYSTSDVDFGSEPQPNSPPMGSFTSDNGLCGGSNVDFNAEDSFDPDGDALTYLWDFGDGTTAEGIAVSHNYSNLEEATVTLTVSDGEFSDSVASTINLLSNPNCEEPVCSFDTPIESPLPSINTSYENVFVLGNGGPNLDNLTSCTINWDLANNGLYQFSVNTNNGIPSWYTNLMAISTQNFNSAQPQITFTNSGFEGLDGNYYATLDGDNLVLVSITGGFTIYFSKSTIVPDCGNVTPPINTAPIAALTATPNIGTTPLEVVFDASASSDIDNDTLTYSIDYGDGTIGSEIISSHIYTTGEYTATITVSDGNGGTDSASVSITVNDDIIINPPTNDCSFNTPIATPLASVNDSYTNAYVLGNGGPNLESVSLFTINWDLSNNGLYQFSFNLNTAPWYMNFSNSVQNFNAINPEITLINTGIQGLDGTYYATIDQENFVLVADGYSIYFSNATTAPVCESLENNAKNTVTRIALKTAEKYSFNMFPNPGITNVTLQNKTDLSGSTISITDLSGKQVKSMSIIESTRTTNINISEIKTGVYFIKVVAPSGISKSQKLIIK